MAMLPPPAKKSRQTPVSSQGQERQGTPTPSSSSLSQCSSSIISSSTISAIDIKDIPCDTKAALLYLITLIPEKLKHQQLPQIVFKHQLYSIVPDRTTVDKSLNKLRYSYEVKLLQLGPQPDDFTLMFTDHYCHHVRMILETTTNSEAVERFLDEVVIKTSDVCYNKSHLIDKLHFKDSDITSLVKSGILAVRDVGSWWLAVPRAGVFLKIFLQGRQTLLRIIRQSKYKEILQNELEKRKLPVKMKLSIQYHIHDIIGADLVSCVETTSGPLLRLCDPNSAKNTVTVTSGRKTSKTAAQKIRHTVQTNTVEGTNTVVDRSDDKYNTKIARFKCCSQSTTKILRNGKLETVFKHVEVIVPELLDSHYAMYTWPSATILGNYICHREQDICDKVILELGSGTSIPGILAGKLNASEVILTDNKLDGKCLDICRKAIELNGVSRNVRAVGLTWGLIDENVMCLPKLDFIFGSDCFYDKKDYEDIFMTVSYLIDQNPSAKFWTTYQIRNADHALLLARLMLEWKLEATVIPSGDFEADPYDEMLTENNSQHTVEMIVIYRKETSDPWFIGAFRGIPKSTNLIKQQG